MVIPSFNDIGLKAKFFLHSIKKEKDDSDDQLLRAGSIFLVGTVIAAGFNYLYQVSMGRMLGPGDYGILGSLFAIIYMVTFSTKTFGLVLSKFSAEFHGKKEFGNLKSLIKKSFRKIAFLGAIALIPYFAASPFIAKFMNLDSVSGVIIVGFIAYFSVLFTILTGALNGLQKFVWQNISNVVSPFIKFFLAIFFVYLGMGVNGALIAVILGFILGIFIAEFPLSKLLKNIEAKHFDPKRIYVFLIPAFLSILFPIFLITLDQILVKHFFSSADAGLYAASGNIGKIIWFCSGFFIHAMFPKIIALKSKNKETKKLLGTTLLYTSFLAIGGSFICFLAPRFVVSIIYGYQYLTASPLIGVFGLALGLFSISQVLIYYNLAAERYGFLFFLFLGLVIEIIGIVLFHKTLFHILTSLLIANIFNLISLLIYTKLELKKDEIQKNINNFAMVC